MPVDYLQGKIYSLRSHQTDQVYYGSTSQILAKRLYEHKHDYKRWTNQTGPYITSCEIVKHSDCYIELVQNYPCASKAELEKREGEIIRAATDAVNKCIPGQTQAEYYQANKDTVLAQKKQYYEANKDALLTQQKLYNEANKDTISAYQKQYRESNKDTAKAYQKQRYEVNKDAILAQRKQYRESNKDTLSAKQKQYRAAQATCPICNSIVSKGSLYGHKKSKRCQSFQLAAQSPLS